MSVPALAESAWQRAKRDAVRTYLSPAFGIGLALVELISLSIAVLFTYDNGDAAVQIAVPVLAGAIANACALLAVVIFAIAAAPIRQRNDLRALWSASQPMGVAEVTLGLKNLRRQGQDLLQNVSPVGYTVEDRSAVEAWTEETVGFLSRHCEQQFASNFIEASAEMPFIPALEERLASLDRIVAALA